MSRPGHTPGTWGEVKFAKLENGQMQARAWYVPTDGGPGRRVKRNGRTRTAARNALLTYLQSLADSTPAATVHDNKESGRKSSARGVTVREAGEMHLDRAAEIVAVRRADGDHIPEGTIYEQTRLIRSNIMSSALGGKMVRTVTVQDVDELYRSMLDTRPQARNTIIELRKVFDTAQQLGHADANPAREFRGMIPKKRPHKYAPGALGLDQFHTVLVAYRTRPDWMGPAPRRVLEDAVETICGTSLRIGEVLGLKWADADLFAEIPTGTVRGTVIEGRGKPKYYQPFTKADGGPRTIPIPDYLVETLRRRLKERRPGEVYVFSSSSGQMVGMHDVHRSLRVVKAWSATTDAVQTIDTEMIPHALRKSVASEVTAKATDGLSKASRLLGHRETGVTETHYVDRPALAPDVRDITPGLVLWAGNAPDA